VERLAPVVPELLQQQPQHGAPQSGLLPLRGRLVVQHHHVRLAPLDEFLLVLVVGDDGADGEVALLQPPQHEARDGQVDGRLDVRGLVQLMGSAVQQQQQGAGPRLQLLLEPLHALTRHHRHGHDHRVCPKMMYFHQGNVNPPVPGCDMKKQRSRGERRQITALNFPRPPLLLLLLLVLRARTHTSTHTLTRPRTHPTRTHRCPSSWSRKLEHAGGFSPSFFLRSDRCGAFIPVHGRPLGERAPTFEGARGATTRPREKPRWSPRSWVPDELHVAKAHECCCYLTCRPAERLWVVISTGCAEEALRLVIEERAGRRDLKAQRRWRVTRARAASATFTTIHWYSLHGVVESWMTRLTKTSANTSHNSIYTRVCVGLMELHITCFYILFILL